MSVDAHGAAGDSWIPVVFVAGRLGGAPAEDISDKIESFPPGESVRLTIKGRDTLAVVVVSQENFHQGFLEDDGNVLRLLVGCALITVIGGERAAQIPERDDDNP